ncbi:hypothetical protein JCM10296v2_003174 [Rhodotorula toruloides]
MLDTIPTELLARIVNLASPAAKPFSVQQKARYGLLKSLSLVNKANLRLTLPANQDLVQSSSDRLADAVTTLSVTVEPATKPEKGSYAEPVEEDLQMLAKLPNVQALFVRTKAVVVDKAEKSWESDPFAFSSIRLDLGADGSLRRLDSLFIMNGVLDLRNLASGCTLSLTRLALCGFLYSATSLYKLFSPSVLPNLRQLRIGPVRREEGAMETPWLKLPKIPKDFLDQLDFLEVGQRTYFGYGPLPESYTATSTPALVMMDEYVWEFPPIQYLHVVKHDPISYKHKFLDKLTHLKAVFVERSHEDSEFAESFHDGCTERGIEIVWCEAEDCDFILPEFEAYIRERQ